MSAEAWDAADLLGALRHATASLRAEIDEVNALNVFPVPDGDTGTNMLATMRSGLERAGDIPARDRTITTVVEALSQGALMGARGNSGVILSQLVRGMAAALRGRDRVDGSALALALEQGWQAAVAAVAHPVEGTMLTVSGEAARAAQGKAAGGAGLRDVLAAAVDAASEAVRRTPGQLRVLADAGVVDAGGRGVELLLRGALGYLRGEPIPTAPRDVLAFPSFAVDEEVGYGYETVFLVQPRAAESLDPDAIRERLDEMGESVLVAGDERVVKVHVHNERPDEVIAFGLSLGSLSEITIENLDRQTRELRLQGRHVPSAEPSVRAVERTAGPAVVAVAAGPGLAGMFADLGATGVVAGGQGANPAAGDLVAAIRATGRTEVIVLPNNPNVRMAAEQADRLLPDVNVSVVPTRNAAEGVAAMLTLNPMEDVAANVQRMTAAGAAVQTLMVTMAVRDSRIGRHQVRAGQHIALNSSEGLLAADSDANRAIIAALREIEPGFELVTLYRGEGVTQEQAAELADTIADQLDGIEVEVVDGGQPHYSYLIAAE
ncbi:MAG TPA: DAK2 domain-containing protein [Candidatus Limnocylindrales bacterium]|nr:DAK2 domain-containing protein [Candidatus Limnocylindrales bacterium]